MKAIISIIPMSLLSILLLSCQPQKTDSRLNEAHEYHQQAGHVRENLGQQLSNTERDSLLHDSLQEFKQALKEWDDAWVEVPGFEHDHKHGEEEHDHHHHNTAPNLSPKEHLELQKHLLEEIQKLEKSFNNRQMGEVN
ncbi:hypothetical protein [Lunatibacter salilacus]|uniref:hypothetical protein n=1 Tax=Lunatibacter salilacus TaxID=2483804 RepID=UPI00131BF3A7|nr:hypothetical protein [Lunatibacter salilacus]